MRSTLSIAALLFLGLTMSAAEPKKEVGPANRLAKEGSPYLLQHAHNPVDWYPWGAEAFEKAKKDKKLVFLSIGYSSCHWCHVMERESFEDKEVAKILNENFVCIKVDREERPDIDEIYMTALQVLDARGGWPLSMFLTDAGKPIIGGTYWPKEDRKIGDDTARGFKSILKYMIEISKTKPKELSEQADAIAAKTEEALTRVARVNALVELNRSLAMTSAEELRERLDPVHGGLGSPPRFNGTKFPSPSSIQTLLRSAKRDKDKELANLVTLTLTKMAEGGIYDQLGGGFHRYSTERTWTVPHFEKMLYDNSQLIELYSEAYQIDPKPLYKRIVDETFRFLQREMTSPEGGFYSALDADSDGEEGVFYVWTGEQIEKALGDKNQAMIFRAAYSVTGAPSFEDKAYVLKISRPMAEVAKDQKLTEEQLQSTLAMLKPKLLEAREKRSRPFLDTKILTAWNGQMISGLAIAGKTFDKPEYTKAAAKAADFVLANLRTKEGRLLRTYSRKSDGKHEAKLNAYLDDYAFLVSGLLSLHDTTGEAKWLNEAKVLNEGMIKWYGDGDKGGYFFTSSDHEKLFARPKDYHDGVQPSGNSVAARNLVRLWQKTGDDQYRKLAEKSFKQFAGVLKGMSTAAPAMAEALHLFLDLGGKKVAEPLEPKKDNDGKPRNSADVVKATAALGPVDRDGKRAVTVTLKIQKPWHLYANPVDHDDLEMARTVVDVHGDGKKLTTTVDYPKGKGEKDAKGVEYKIYEDEVVIKGVTTVKDAKEFEVRVKVAACTSGENGRCLLPATITIPVK
jgi:uncharacterized protein YyaL (SSP411 family)